MTVVAIRIEITTARELKVVADSMGSAGEGGEGRGKEGTERR